MKRVTSPSATLDTMQVTSVHLPPDPFILPPVQRDLERDGEEAGHRVLRVPGYVCEAPRSAQHLPRGLLPDRRPGFLTAGVPASVHHLHGQGFSLPPIFAHHGPPHGSSAPLGYPQCLDFVLTGGRCKEVPRTEIPCSALSESGPCRLSWRPGTPAHADSALRPSQGHNSERARAHVRVCARTYTHV